MDVLDSYADTKPISELSSLHCRAVSISHKQSNPLSELPAARELISSGNLQIISNERIRRAVSNYLGVLDIIRDRRTSTQLFMVDITGLYPDIIQIDPQNARRLNEGINPDNRCDFELGRDNQQFINHLSMNSGRQWQLTRSISIYEQITALEHLGQLIEKELVLNHQ